MFSILCRIVVLHRKLVYCVLYFVAVKAQMDIVYDPGRSPSSKHGPPSKEMRLLDINPPEGWSDDRPGRRHHKNDILKIFSTYAG